MKFHLIVKGSSDDVLKENVKRGFRLTDSTEMPDWVSVFANSDRKTISDWFIEDLDPPFKSGSLLFYREVEHVAAGISSSVR
jgi:hypothetical protein